MKYSLPSSEKLLFKTASILTKKIVFPLLLICLTKFLYVGCHILIKGFILQYIAAIIRCFILYDDWQTKHITYDVIFPIQVELIQLTAFDSTK